MPNKPQIRWSFKTHDDNEFIAWLDARDVVERFVNPTYKLVFNRLEGKTAKLPLGPLLHGLLVQTQSCPVVFANVVMKPSPRLVAGEIQFGQFLPCAALELGQLQVPIRVVVKRRKSISPEMLPKLPLYVEKDLVRAGEAERLSAEIESDLEESARRLVS